MKRIISKLLVLIMVSIMLIPNVAAYSSHIDNNLDIIKLAYIKDVGNKSDNLKTSIIDDNQFTIFNNDLKATITNDEISIIGTINKIPIRILAQPKSNATNLNVHLYNSKDLEENINIVYCSYEREVDKSSLYFRDYYNNNRKDIHSILKIYAIPKDSKDFVIIEIFNPKLDQNRFFTTSLTNGINKESDEYLDQFWYAKVFEPVEQFIELENRNSLMSINTQDNLGRYTFTFNHLGGTINQVFEVCRFISWPDSFSNHGSFVTRFGVTDEYTQSDDWPNDEGDWSYMRASNVKIDIAADSNNYCDRHETDGSVHKSSGVNVSYGFNLLNIGSIASITASYSNGGTHDINDNVSHNAPVGGKYPKQLRVALGSSYRLEDVGHYFSCDWRIANESAQPATNKELKIKFTYTMTNLLDYTHWINGVKTYTKTVRYDTD
ncbi:hypothetical protein [Alkaliphilus serpentinus]|uniref:Uncharacterized protein n=1 Tax=Alkaliphilus serpentinus TaxID=1482731 RepID=A0A833MCE3_9FIRM|nr:hypothetical protein [Alkaliphilus serpentinus]KAB3524797.1 hypothetical protein F8153_15790 [Alkaliphilus serpentinus]